MGFPPWDPMTDMSKKYHRGKIPIHITNIIQTKGLREFSPVTRDLVPEEISGKI